MIDPLSALGLASNILQFVEFGCKLVSDGYELHENGSLSGVDELELVTKDLICLAKDLTAVNPPQSKTSPSADGDGLQQLAASCKSIADELIHVLSSLKPRNSHNGIESFRAAFRKARKKGAIENLEKRLEKIQNQLNIRLIAMLSNSQSEVSSNLDFLTSEAKRNGIDVVNRIDSMRLEVLAAIKKQQKQSKQLRGYTGQDVGVTCKHLADEARWVANSQRILKSLHYEHITEREANVKDAQLHTFEWIFDDAFSKVGSQTRFVDWMEFGEGIYWISGKAGSGKSTLIKYISRHNRTLKMLQTWAEHSKLVLASHFFWSAGNQMQKSQIGLLQSLLYQILKECPQLIEALCPIRWSTDNFYDDKQEPWSLRELSEAFQNLVDCDHFSEKSTPKFCFFVDGLDEYDGEHREVINILQTMTKNSNIKICVSSRPWNVFEKAFGSGSCYKLLLQEFTRADIKLYVQTKLEEDEEFLKLAEGDSRYQQLILDIVEKAQGVFLWVFLVVRSLLRGLSDENEFSFLQKRLNELPSDLEEYFFHILNTVEPIYQESTTMILNLVMHGNRPLPAIAIFFLEKEKIDPDYALKLDLQLTETDIASISQRMRKHVNACCKDLLEVNVTRYEDSFLQHKIDFLHRTVRDFLLTKEMIHILRSGTTADFDPYVSLCRIVLSQIKTYPLTMVKSAENQPLMIMIHELFHYARKAEIHNGIPQVAILDELDRVLSDTALKRKTMGPFPASYSGLLQDYNLSVFLNLAIDENLKLYVASKLSQDPTLAQRKSVQKPMLYHALHLAKHDPLTIWDADIEMVRLLLDNGADVNEKSKGLTNTIWGSYLIRCLERRYEPSYKYRQHDTFLVTELLLQHGANMALKIKTNMIGGIRTAWPTIIMATSEIAVLECCPEYMNARDILTESFPNERAAIARLFDGSTKMQWLWRWF